MRQRLYPISFTPILKPLIWGGSRIGAYKGLDIATEGIGESWELSAVDESQSVVAEGPLQGYTLHDLIVEYQELFVGEKVYQRYGDHFPLMVKLIDAAEDLSIQVHPDDEMAHKRHQTNGKTEMWYIIDAAPESRLYTGLKRGTSPEDVKRHLQDHTLCDVLNYESTKPGDVFMIPAGRVHSIGSGILLAEVQQSSDVTYRLWDYDRRDAQGNPRQLHIDLALEAIDHTYYNSYKTEYQRRLGKPVRLAQCPYFTTNLLESDTVMVMDYRGLDSFVIWLCIEGEATYTSTRRNNGRIAQGNLLLFPACDQPKALIPIGKSVKILEVYIN
ncbi:MAG: class I mannose-6-phosphate isomerase [Paludibacteraceae bacterium]|nr:class I mannose-6-phosphate isomerase [Paludibacteraceae bacterium]